MPARLVREWVKQRFSAVVGLKDPHVQKLNNHLPWKIGYKAKQPERVRRISRGAGFGETVQNKKVEQAAVRAVTADFRKNGWGVESVERLNRGYDLLCSKGPKVAHVEVKGVSGDRASFIITSNERTYAQSTQDFILSVVCDALSRKPVIKKWNGQQMKRAFEFKVLQYQASLKNQ